GQPGLNGRDGVDGHNGVDGQPGLNGRDGVDGHNGVDGQPGLNGRDGVDGQPGTNGKDGVDAKVEFSTIDVQVFDSCDTSTKQPKFKTETIQVIQGTEAQELLNFQRTAQIEAQQCSQTEYYSAVPEWWQIRIEAGRPQMIFMFAQKMENGNFGSPKYPLTIPHPIVQHYSTSPLPDYKKGQYEALLTLKDNSKLIINAFSVEEAQKMLDACKALIQPEYLEGAIQRPIAPRKGPELLEIDVIAKRAEYFSTGLKNTKPDWIDSFT
ncbi:MAG: hypothetical protein V7L07_14015, partial [Nostoc sp.]